MTRTKRTAMAAILPAKKKLVGHVLVLLQSVPRIAGMAPLLGTKPVMIKKLYLQTEMDAPPLAELRPDGPAQELLQLALRSVMMA